MDDVTKRGLGVLIGLGVMVGAIGGLVYLAIKSGKITEGVSGVQLGACNGCTSVQGLPASKERAHQWLQAQMRYQGENPVEHQVIEDVTSMEVSRSGDFRRVLLRAYGSPVTHEYVDWQGIGRPQ